MILSVCLQSKEEWPICYGGLGCTYRTETAIRCFSLNLSFPYADARDLELLPACAVVPVACLLLLSSCPFGCQLEDVWAGEAKDGSAASLRHFLYCLSSASRASSRPSGWSKIVSSKP